MNAFIKAIAYTLGDNEVTNEQLSSEFPEWSVEKIAQKVGINKRYIASERQTSSDLAVFAAEKLFTAHPETKREDVDFILFCTQSPDYFLPTSACLIQERLGLPTTCGALDFNLGCSGYVYGLSLAKGLVVSGIARNILLLTGETYSKFIHTKDKGNRTIFGDAGSATLISTEGFAEIGDFVLGTDGKGADNLIVKSGAYRHKHPYDDLTFDDKGNPRSSDFLYMNGTEIFSFSQERVPEMVNALITKSGLSPEEIDGYVFHQANSFMLDFLRKKLKIAKDKFYYHMSEVGNTVSSTIPIVLFEKRKENILHGTVLIAGFGVGYSWGGCILNIR